MKKPILTGIAALFLATGTAHAYPPHYYNCGRVFLKTQTGHGTLPSGRRYFPTVWTVSENAEWEDRRSLPEIGSFNFKSTKDGKYWFNGKLCRKMSDEEGHNHFGDEDAD
jgi:hypothetical protein